MGSLKPMIGKDLLLRESLSFIFNNSISIPFLSKTNTTNSPLSW
jgi:hypothetical protein